MKSIVLVSVYLGPLPNWMPLWLKCCKANPTIEFRVITDQPDTLKRLPDNVRAIATSIKDLRERLSEAVGFSVALENGYKLCDFRPAYGLAFSDYFSSFSHWGHVDLDQLFGKIENFIPWNTIDEYERLYHRGHMTIYRNSAIANNLFRLSHPSVSYEKLFKSPKHAAFDETEGIYQIVTHNHIPQDDYLVCSGEQKAIISYQGDCLMGKRVHMLTVGEFRAQFGEEAQCAEQLTRQRWPEGFECPRCSGGTRGYIASRRVHECKLCGYQCSVTAGTIFHKTRTPLSSWFWAIYRMGHDKKGISALQLAKEIGVSYTTAWLMQHKIRKAMEDRDQRYKLHGIIEVDEGYVGGAESGEGLRGRGTESKCAVAVAVEHAAEGEPGRPPVPGFAALQVLPDASSKSIDGFLGAKIAPGSQILSDGWGGYRKLNEKGFEHTATVLSSQNEPAHVLFPWVHISLANLKRFLLGTHHQTHPKHLKRYVAEFNYRLNRRSMEMDLLPRLLRACLGTQTITLQQLTEGA